MKSFLKQPLVHFLLIGLGFFLLFRVFGDDNEIDSKTVVVDKEALMTYLQYRSKAFNAEVFEEKLASLPQEELDRMIEDYVREEVLYREAMAMGLDREDYIIKNRMIQKVEFLSEGIGELAVNITDEDLENFYEENKDKYYEPARVTFTHVFFKTDNRGFLEASQLAESTLKELNLKKVPFEKAPAYGERFYYNTNYVQKGRDYVVSHFGEEMANTILEADPNTSQWIGPLRSEYGYHLVLIAGKQEGLYPALEEIKERVLQDARYERKEEIKQQSIQAVIDGYTVEVTYKRPEIN